MSEQSLPSNQTLRTIPDGEPLYTLPNSLVIVRRRKHEWTADLNGLTGAKLVRATDKVRGSKFVSEWDLQAYVERMVAAINSLEWDENTTAATHVIEYNEVIGWSFGKPVKQLRIVVSSRSVHGYPVSE